MKLTAIMVAALVAAVLAAPLQMVFAGGNPPAVGTPAPDFTLQSQDGKPVSLHDFKGKWVVLYFYPKDFTGGCTIEAHNFQRDQAQYDAKNAAIVGVSVQDTDSHQKFCTKEGLSFKLLADTKHDVSSAYGSLTDYGVTALSSRHTFLIDPDGNVRKVYMNVTPAKHSEEVLADLSELQKVASAK
jgi:peroxiredoxin Q/BCP